TTVVFENTAIVRTEGPDPSSTPAVPANSATDRGGTYGALTWRLTEADFRSIRDAFQIPEPVKKGMVDGSQIVKDCQRKLDDPHAFLDEARRAQLTWELEQAQNHER